MKVFSLVAGLDVGERTLFRWKRAYLKKGLYGLLRKRHRGIKKKIIGEEAAKLIGLMRGLNLWGPEVIHHHLRLDHGHNISMYRINKHLNESGLRLKYPLRKFNPVRIRKKHQRVVKVLIPGAHTQMDVNHQPHLINQKSYIYNFIDHATNWTFKRVYFRICPDSTIDFIRRVVKICPFKIFRLQTDNGTEFTYKYISKYQDDPVEHPLNKFCGANKIQHRLIIPGEKEVQGLVERSHRQDKDELLHRLKVETLDEFNAELSFYNAQRNKGRRFKKLGWISPNDSIERFLIVTWAMILIYKKKKIQLTNGINYRKKMANNLEITEDERSEKIKEILSIGNNKKAA